MTNQSDTSAPHVHKELSTREKLLDLEYRIRTVVPAKIALLRAIIRRGGKRRKILFYPRQPNLWHILYSVCHQLGYEMTTDQGAKTDLVFYFDDETATTLDQNLAKLIAKGPVVNGSCLDIGKERVEKVFTEVFGYSMAVDPRTATGVYVRKSNENTAHDGKIMEGPSEPEPGYIYQKLIDTAVGDKVIDSRVIVMNGTIPIVMHRIKSVTDRFDNTESSKLVDINTDFNPTEIQKIIEFTKKFGLDCGELDVLRDKNDGKIYIVDANKTSGSPRPRKHVTPQEFKEFLGLMSSSFEAQFLSKKNWHDK